MEHQHKTKEECLGWLVGLTCLVCGGAGQYLEGCGHHAPCDANNHLRLCSSCKGTGLVFPELGTSIDAFGSNHSLEPNSCITRKGCFLSMLDRGPLGQDCHGRGWVLKEVHLEDIVFCAQKVDFVIEIGINKVDIFWPSYHHNWQGRGENPNLIMAGIIALCEAVEDWLKEKR